MDPATQPPRPSNLTVGLAGLQAGMLGVCWMLAWLGISAKWQLRSFWTAENLMASVFYGDGAIRSGFAGRTLSGLALYLLLYSSLGAFFAFLVADRLPRLRVVLASVLFAMCWYYLSFQLLWKSVMPLVALLHSGPPTALGHVIYGTVLGRYPVYLPKAPVAPDPEIQNAAAPEIQAAAPETQDATAAASSDNSPES
jgi:hypothetical protein